LLFFSLEVSAKGGIRALDRLPRPELLAEAREAAQKHSSELLICFGGNGRSSGFSGMVRDDKARAKFIENLIKLCDRHGFNGVDYNWEYPGFVFGSGYQSEDDVEADYQGLEKLLADTRAAFDAAAAKAPTGSIAARRRLITLAYYPDGKQEQLLAPMQRYVDMMHMMTCVVVCLIFASFSILY
jgi:GH18 family chitinase